MRGVVGRVGSGSDVSSKRAAYPIAECRLSLAFAHDRAPFVVGNGLQHRPQLFAGLARFCSHLGQWPMLPSGRLVSVIGIDLRPELSGRHVPI